MRIVHDSCVDTSVIFPHEQVGFKKSLKHLAEKHLGLKIQTSNSGHCSAEDAITALRLTYLKVKKGVSFGVSKYVYQSMFEVMDKLKKKCAVVAPGAIGKWMDVATADLIPIIDRSEAETKAISSVSNSKYDIVFCSLPREESDDMFTETPLITNPDSATCFDWETLVQQEKNRQKNALIRLDTWLEKISKELPPNTLIEVAFTPNGGLVQTMRAKRNAVMSCSSESESSTSTSKNTNTNLKWCDYDDGQLTELEHSAQTGGAFFLVTDNFGDDSKPSETPSNPDSPVLT
eukprot:TRINITY_DN3399_c0_g1_i2.p1 TRINITY_DN3399_c0_g1~~TRINITY_DN3399_c0_g1_i2.p1  ORF type:complete len:301 (+),score=79.14 TRINITY_DN3399_c0_g1_i2:36-905(+)